MTTMMWKRTKKILAEMWVTVAKPLLRSGVLLRNDNKQESNLANAIILKHFINVADDFICSRMKVTEKKKRGVFVVLKTS